MNISPELYNNSNYLQRRDGKRLVQRIIDDLEDKHFDRILDIGCGTGNITDDMALRLSHSELIGVDISESMIEFANKNFKRESVKYLTADICEDWLKLSERLGLCEESVDLIISVYCLHWVSDLDQAIKNINKLLKPGGVCYVLLFSWSDLLPIQQKMALMEEWQQYFYAIPKNWTKINEKSRETIRKLSEHLAPFPVFEAPKEEQILTKWQQICVQNGLVMPETILTHTYYRFNSLKEFRNELQALCHFLPFIPEERREEFLSDYFQLVDDDYLYKQFEKRELTDESAVKLNYDYIIVVANKNPD